MILSVEFGFFSVENTSVAVTTGPGPTGGAACGRGWHGYGLVVRKNLISGKEVLNGSPPILIAASIKSFCGEIAKLFIGMMKCLLVRIYLKNHRSSRLFYHIGLSKIYNTLMKLIDLKTFRHFKNRQLVRFAFEKIKQSSLCRGYPNMFLHP